MASKGKTDYIARITAAVAIGSLLLNVWQFYAASHEQTQKQQREQTERAPEAFYAYCDDHTLKRLYEGEINMGSEPGLSALSVRHGSAADKQIKAWLEHSGGSEVILRGKPTASFLVVGNRLDYPIRNLRVSEHHGPSVDDTLLLSTELLRAKEYVFVPLDFRPPGNDSAEPSTPVEVVVEYGEQREPLRVKSTDPIDWLNRQFLRGLIRSKPTATTN